MRDIIDVQFRSPETVEKEVLRLGFLPFFNIGIEGFSIEEHTPRELWFSDEQDGPWEWKGPIIVQGNCAYGKFFEGKACYVSLDWLPDFINVRRSLYIMKDEEISREKLVYDAVVAKESMLTTEIRQECGFAKPRAPKLNPLEKLEAGLQKKIVTMTRSESLDTILTRLQMSTHFVVADFEYKQDKHGKPYGWGVARYATPEALYGNEILKCPYSPKQSYKRIKQHLLELLGEDYMLKVEKMIKWPNPF